MDTDWSSGLDLFLDLDRGDGLRHGIEHALREAIRDRRLTAGTAMPSSRSLARDLGVARGTVSAAFGQLAAEGYLAVRQGASARVSWVPPRQQPPTPALVNPLKGVPAGSLRSQFSGRMNRHAVHGRPWWMSFLDASSGSAPLTIIRPWIEQQNRPG